jgi:hypothetical protein
MKPVMAHPPTKFSRTQDVTHPLRADLAPLDHFRSIGELTRDSARIPATHHHHIHHSRERSLVVAIHSDNCR